MKSGLLLKKIYRLSTQLFDIKIRNSKSLVQKCQIEQSLIIYLSKEPKTCFLSFKHKYLAIFEGKVLEVSSSQFLY